MQLMVYGKMMPGTLASELIWARRLLRSKLGWARKEVIPLADRKWWQKPGLGIFWTVEYQPGWSWERDFVEFKATIMDKSGRLKFKGPFCKIDDWVALARKVGVNYHSFYGKWHDGICFFDTKLTDWKTEIDYTARFAELSREAGIPWVLFYSTIYDHNPQFDSIQPNPHSTQSWIGVNRQPVYEEYLRGQYRELVDQYSPDGIWLDWWWPGYSANIMTLRFLRENFPDLAVTYNLSNLFLSSQSKLDYTSGEAHDLDGGYVKLVKSATATLPMLSSTWKWANLHRRLFDQPWEVISPAGKFWHDPTLRDDRRDLLRMAAITMACGGKSCIGVLCELDGTTFPDQVEQLLLLGEWYVPRRELFAESTPLRYTDREPKGVTVDQPSVKTVASRLGQDTLLHLINMRGATGPVKVETKGESWARFQRVFLEPGGRELGFDRSNSKIKLLINEEDVDQVDTILRFAYA